MKFWTGKLLEAWGKAQKQSMPDGIPPFVERISQTIRERKIITTFVGTKTWGVTYPDTAYSVYCLVFFCGFLIKKYLAGTTRSGWYYKSPEEHREALADLKQKATKLCEPY